ncbi:MAG: YbgC/FadM family acyl-CoA thioesterase [Chitinivibrionales bacterium]|nr:YbgC/FadM family acyl-CoA thioesterase [Chitinivibrionales bacterium]
MRKRVYYEDTDWGGVGYYANYLRYAEAGRTEYLRERGISLSELHARGYLFVVVDVHARYRAPARYDDLLDVRTKVTESSTLTITFESRVYNQSGNHLVTVKAKLACVNTQGRIERVPDEVAELLAG